MNIEALHGRFLIESTPVQIVPRVILIREIRCCYPRHHVIKVEHNLVGRSGSRELRKKRNIE